MTVAIGTVTARSSSTEWSGLSRKAVWGLSVAWVVLASWLQLARMTGSARPWNSLWAEDGGVFLTDAYQHSLFSNLFRPHAGYFQVICRLVAQPAGHLPAAWGAAWMAWGAAVVVALCSLIVWNRARLITRHWGARVAVTLLLPFMPQVADEVTGAVNDLHWYLIYTLFWVLITPPRSIRGGALAAFFAALVGLSDPLSALMLLAAAGGWWLAGRSVRTLLGAAGLVTALVAQYAVHSVASFGPGSDSAIPRIYALRVVLSSLTGDRLLSTIYPHFATRATEVACVVMVVIVVVLARKAHRRSLTVGAICIALSGLYLGVELATRGTAGLLTRAPFMLNGSRYTIVPLWMLFTALVLLADGWAGPGPQFTARLVRVPLALTIVCSWLAVETLSDWSEPGTRGAALPWDAQVAQAKASCLRPIAKRYRVPPLVLEGLVGPDDVVIPVAPFPAPGQPALFGVLVSCNRLQA